LGFQLNTHCIGDSANRLLLNIYSKYLKGKNDFRWRIEHAQVVNENDFELFGKYSIIPSVQPTHATSDMYWANDRIGGDRLKGAYAYARLLNQAGMLAGGSDFPVEDINPLFGFYAAVSRKDQKSFPQEGFQMENAISRKDALKSMTIWPAFASFEENVKGSLEPNKFADFVILNEDLLTVAEDSLFKLKVQQTYSAGKLVYSFTKE
jgi:predicted amidohydrolase YtcJ